MDYNFLKALDKIAIKEAHDIQYYSGGSKYNAYEEQIKDELLKAFRAGELDVNTYREELALRKAERTLLVQNREINCIIQNNLERNNWFISSKGFLTDDRD